ncbi:hypothetical protein GCM10027425_21500 [Alteromonas gracilis]
MNTPTPASELVSARIAALRDLVSGARPMPMSSSVMVNKSDVLHLLDELEESIDQATQEATALVGKRAEMVSASQSEADLIVRDAQLEAERLVGDTEVYRIALREADALRTKAEEDAAALRRDTDAYVDQRLGSFQVTLEQTMEAVQRGRARLADAHARSYSFDEHDDEGDGWPGEGPQRPPGPEKVAG